jgi:hypothetical protein
VNVGGQRGAYLAVGGGIGADNGTLTLKHSVIKDNAVRGNGLQSASAFAEGGGGIGLSRATPTPPALIAANSTIKDNTATGQGGGGIRSGRDLRLVNDTVANNETQGDGGGVSAFGSTHMNAVTVARNVADSNDNQTGIGGGLASHGSSPIAVHNSLLALNLVGSTGQLNNDCDGSFLSNHHNLLTSPCAGFEDGDIVTDTPGISQLANNGGATETIALDADSPAIGAASPVSAPTTDQRGVPRDAMPDIGAFER